MASQRVPSGRRSRGRASDLFLFGGLTTILLFYPTAALAGRGNDLVHAKLVTDTASPQPDKVFRIGVLFTIEPGWHIYWRNPGDSGLPTRLTPKLPEGYVAGPVQFPLPSKLTFPGDIVNYGYEKQTMLVVPVTAPGTVKPGDAIRVDTRWLVCQDVCLPGSATLSLKIGDAAAVRPALFSDLPLPVDHDSSVLGVGIRADAHAATFKVRWNGSPPPNLQFFPPPTPGFEIRSITCETKGAETTIHYQATPTTASSQPVPTDGLLEFTVAGGRRVGLNLIPSP